MANPVRRFPPLPSIRDILRMYQITAKKSMSQNFILDPAILRRIAKAAGVLKGKYVIEVGPGPGGITRSLLENNPKQVLVIEKDPRFIPSLQLLQEAAGGPSKLKINIGDCLHYNVEKLIPESEVREWDSPETPDVRLVGNLPFNVATPFLIRLLNSMHTKTNLFKYGRVPSVLTFQHEVAHRMTAGPNDPERCRLSVICQNYAQVEYLFMLPGGAFVPRPEVDVGVVRLTPLRKPYISISEDEPLTFEFVNKVVTTLFHNKKKYLRTNLSKLFPDEDENYPWKMSKAILNLTGLDHDRTAVSLSMQEIEQICIAYHHLCQENTETLNHVDPLVQSEIDATSRCLNWSEEFLSDKVDDESSEKPMKFDIKF